MKIGLDIGFPGIKCVVLDDALNITYKTYERHFSHIVEKRRSTARPRSFPPAPAWAWPTPAACPSYRRCCHRAKRYAPDARVVIELGGEMRRSFLNGRYRDGNGSCAGGA